jgi:RsiW-degrading membrane proteinase PrsW (M82 family)
VGSEYMGPFPDSTPQNDQRFPPRRPSPPPSERFDDEDTQPKMRAVPSRVRLVQQPVPGLPEEPAYREHVTGSLAVPRSEAPKFRPAYQPYQAAPGSMPSAPQMRGPQQQQFYPYAPGYGPPPAYNGQHGYPYPPMPYGYYYPGYYPYWYPQKPRRSGYQLAAAITSFVGSILSIITGFICLFIFLITAFMPATSSVSQGTHFAGLMEFLAFALAGLAGGGFALYHSIRAWFFPQKVSQRFKLPPFWAFLGLYLLVIAVGTYLYFTRQSVAYPVLTALLIVLCGILPAATIMALGLRRIHFPKQIPWPTTWRRFAVALISGSTLGILLALIFEMVLSVVVSLELGVKITGLDNPDQPIPTDARSILFMFILVSVIAPLVEEAVKPLAVVVLIGRIRSAAEAFVLGMACGIGFDLVETTGYIGQGYQDWLSVALQRSSAGLLHGFGAGMVALGWYFITHRNSTGKANRILLALGCWGYAIMQHALWNGSFGLELLPAPIGPYLSDGTLPFGPITLPAFILVYVVESVLMLIFFLFVTRKLRAKNEEQQPPASVHPPRPAPINQPGYPQRVPVRV